MRLISLITLLTLLSCKNKSHYNYPKITSETKNEVIHDTEIKDYYRNIENLNDSSVKNWISYQKLFADSLLSSFSDKRLSFNNDLKTFSKIHKLKISKNDYQFYLKKDKTDEPAKLYYKKNISDNETLLFNPNNDQYSINYIQPNWNASRIVIGLTKNDEEYSELKVLDIETKEILPYSAKNASPNSLGGIDWLPDNKSFLYTHIPLTKSMSEDYKKKPKIVKFNTDTGKTSNIFIKKSNSKIVLEEGFYPLAYLTSNDNKYTLATLAGPSMYRDTYFTETKTLGKDSKWKFLHSKEEQIQSFLIEGNTLYFLTSKNASNFKLCKTTLISPNFKKPIILIDEDKDAVISDFAVTNKGVFYVKTKNGVEAKLFFLDEKTGKQKAIKLPKPFGYINLKAKSHEYDDLWIEAEGWTNNLERYKYNFKNENFETANLDPIVKDSVLDNVIIEEIEIPSHDGTMVPLSIIHKKGLKKNKTNRLLINAYGAYKWSNTPYLYPYLLHWVKQGGVYAIAHVRGGGEKGDPWHKAGFKTTKPNTWKDLIACTEYFIKNNYVTKDKIAVWGASAGGIAVGRAITERPDLYSAAVIRVGILNPLRREFDAKGGKFNIKEFGTIKDSTEFKALYEMDPYQNIKNGIKYPAVYLTAGMNDTRLSAWQPAKFAARLQEATTSNKPVLLSVDFEGGHGFEASQDKKNKEMADIMSFLFWQTGHPDFQPKK